jgi:hypothetical protein
MSRARRIRNRRNGTFRDTVNALGQLRLLTGLAFRAYRMDLRRSPSPDLSRSYQFHFNELSSDALSSLAISTACWRINCSISRADCFA